MIAKGPYTLLAALALIAVVVYVFNFAVSVMYDAYSKISPSAAAEVDKRAQQVAPTLQLIVNAIAAAAVVVAAVIGYKQIRPS